MVVVAVRQVWQVWRVWRVWQARQIDQVVAQVRPVRRAVGARRVRRRVDAHGDEHDALIAAASAVVEVRGGIAAAVFDPGELVKLVQGPAPAHGASRIDRDHGRDAARRHAGEVELDDNHGAAVEVPEAPPLARQHV